MTKPNPNQLLAALEAQIKNLDTTPPRLVGTLYGDPGSAKTVLAHQIAQIVTPPNKKILTVDTSDSMVTLLDWPQLRQRVVPITYENVTQFAALIGAIKGGVGSFSDIGTVVIDEMSSVGDAAILAVGKAREQGGDNKVGDDALDQRDYLIARNQIARIMNETNGLRALKTVNIIMTAHARHDKDNNNVVSTSMEFPAKMKLDINKMSSFVGYCKTEMVVRGGKLSYERKVQVLPTMRVAAKIRFGGFTDPIISQEQLLQAVARFIQRNTNPSITESEPANA